jgi:glycine oxidase
VSDFIIVGQGLAGTTLAWQLFLRGASFTIIDEEVASTSSKVAAGIVNPITGKYFAKSWRIDESWPVARAFYREIEKRTGARLFYEMPLVRLLTSEAEVARWGKKAGSESHADYLASPQPDTLLDGALFETELGGFETTNSGYLDVREFLAASREVFRSMGSYRSEVFDGEEREGGVVLCQGFKGAKAPGFDWVPFKSAKGEILTLRPKVDLPTDRIVNGGGAWLLPDQAQPGTFRAGSTYSWDLLDSETTAGGREEILEKLRRICKVEFDVVGQEAAVRPIIRASKALIGLHPGRDGLAIFNGLGSKGVLNAPFFAGQLAELLVDGTPVDEEVDIRKNAL